MDHLLPADPHGDFAAFFNRCSFAFAHGLREHPLCSSEALTGLAERLSQTPDAVGPSGDDVALANGLGDDMVERISRAETVRGVADNASGAVLRHAEQDPVHGPLMRALLAACVKHAGVVLRADLMGGEAQILIASPGHSTSRRFDDELTYRFQVRGDATVVVFDLEDRTGVSDVELEQYFGGDPGMAGHSAADECGASRYSVRAGQGVQIPCLAPHRVQNGDNVSVAILILFRLRSVARLGQVCWLNRYLRKGGLRPASPYAPTLRNRVKRWMAAVLQPLHRRWHRLPRSHSHEVWIPD